MIGFKFSFKSNLKNRLLRLIFLNPLTDKYQIKIAKDPKANIFINIETFPINKLLIKKEIIRIESNINNLVIP